MLILMLPNNVMRMHSPSSPRIHESTPTRSPKVKQAGGGVVVLLFLEYYMDHRIQDHDEAVQDARWRQ